MSYVLRFPKYLHNYSSGQEILSKALKSKFYEKSA